MPEGLAQGIRTGYSTVSPDPGQKMPAGNATITTSNSSGIVISRTVVAGSSGLQSARIRLDETGSRTGIVLVNPSPQPPQEVRLVARNDAGLEIGNKAIPLRSGEQVIAFAGDLLTSLQNQRGTLTLQGAYGIGVVALRETSNSWGEVMYSAIPVIDLGATRTAPAIISVPDIGAGASKRLVLLNPVQQEIAGRVEILGTDGRPLLVSLNGVPASDSTYRMPPEGAFEIEVGIAPGIEAYGRVVPDGGGPTPAVFLNIRQIQGDRPATETFLSAAPTTLSGQVFVETRNIQNRVVVVNPAESDATISLKLLDAAGELVRQGTRSLPPRNEVMLRPEDLFPAGAAEFVGRLDLQSTLPVAISAIQVAANGRNTNLITSEPLIDLSPSSLSPPLIFPYLVIGSIFSTKLVLVDADKGIASGTMRYFSSDGLPMPIELFNRRASEFPYIISPGGHRQWFTDIRAKVTRLGIVDPAANVTSTEIAINIGNRVRPRFRIVDDSGTLRDDLPITYSSIDPAIASIDGSGFIVANTTGFSTLELSASGFSAVATISVPKIQPKFIAYGPSFAREEDHTYYVAYTDNHTILSVDPDSEKVKVYAGKPNEPGSQEGPLEKSQFRGPSYISISPPSRMYVSDTLNHRIRLIKEGQVSLFSGTGVPGAQDGKGEASFSGPQGVVYDGTSGLWVADTGNHTIRRIDVQTREVKTIAGAPGAPGNDDGVGTSARFNTPVGIAIQRPLNQDLSGPVRVIVADSGNGRVRRINYDPVSTTANVETLAGLSTVNVETLAGLSTLDLKITGNVQSSSDRLLDDSPQPVQFGRPTDVAVDPVGNIFVSASDSHELKIMLRTGQVVDAVEPNTLQKPRGISIDDAGIVTVVDYGSSVREIRFGQPEITGPPEPNRVRSRGGATVVLKGRNFAPDTIVVVGPVVITSVIVRDTQNLSFTMPSGVPGGLTTLTVQNRGGIAQTSLLVEPTPLSELSPGQITTIVGGSTYSGDGGFARSASIGLPKQLAIDGAGNLLIADYGNHRIRRIDKVTGIINSLAGNGFNTVAQGGLSISRNNGDGGPAVAATLSFPTSVATDTSGNMFIADQGNSRVREVNAVTGRIETIAGTIAGYSGDGPGVKAKLNQPTGVASDPDGNLYIADSFNHIIRKLNTAGTIKTVAGNHLAGFTNDGPDATATRLSTPEAVAIDAAGNLIIADSANGRVRLVDDAGGIRTIAGQQVGQLNYPNAVSVDPSGTVLIADSRNNRIVALGADGSLSTVAGSGTAGRPEEGQLAADAYLNNPQGVVAVGSNVVYVADTGNNAIRRIADDRKSGRPVITTVAGTGELSFQDTSRLAIATNLRSPFGLAMDGAGNLYISDQGNARILKVDSSTQRVTIFAGAGSSSPLRNDRCELEPPLASPMGLSMDQAGNLYVADSGSHLIRKVAPDGSISTYAGNGEPGFSGDGPATLVSLKSPSGVAVDSQGNLYIADTGNSRIRKVDLHGSLTTIAGGNNPPLGGGPDSSISLKEPRSVAVDAAGNIYIADLKGAVQRLDGKTKILTTVVRNLEYPAGVTVDSVGNVFIALAYSTSQRIVKLVNPDTGETVPVAGRGEPGYSGDEGPAVNASLLVPTAMLIDGHGNMIFADTDNDRIRAVRLVTSGQIAPPD
jgi:sugar lactone lactonase YvrE